MAFTGCSDNSMEVNPIATEFKDCQFGEYFELVNEPTVLTCETENKKMNSSILRLKVKLRVKKASSLFQQDAFKRLLDFSWINLLDANGAILENGTMMLADRVAIKELLQEPIGTEEEVEYCKICFTDIAESLLKHSVKILPYDANYTPDESGDVQNVENEAASQQEMTNQQKAEKKVSVAKENTDKTEFLKSFYMDYILGGRKNFDEIAKDVCTPRLLQYLMDKYEWDCPEGDCYEISCFRTDNQDGSDENLVKSVTALEDNWYKVEYLDMGHKGTTKIHFVEDNGCLKMDEISQ